MSIEIPKSMRFFDLAGRRLEVLLYPVSNEDGRPNIKAKPRTYGDLHVALSLFFQFGAELLTAENKINGPEAGGDAQNAINDDGFTRDWLDYCKLMNLGYLTCLDRLGASSGNFGGQSSLLKQCSGNTLSQLIGSQFDQRNPVPAPSDKQGA